MLNIIYAPLLYNVLFGTCSFLSIKTLLCQLTMCVVVAVVWVTEVSVDVAAAII